MAFIRWKKNKYGTRHAYLIQSYRDQEGKPKHKTLSYLGRDGNLSPERLEALRARHSALKINWDAIQPVPHPVPATDVSMLDDHELLRRLRELRTERQLSAKAMTQALLNRDLPPLTEHGHPKALTVRRYLVLEQGLEQGRMESYYTEPGAFLVPYIRKVLGA